MPKDKEKLVVLRLHSVITILYKSLPEKASLGNIRFILVLMNEGNRLFFSRIHVEFARCTASSWRLIWVA